MPKLTFSFFGAGKDDEKENVKKKERKNLFASFEKRKLQSAKFAH